MRKFASDVLLCCFYCYGIKMKNVFLEKEKSKRQTETSAKKNKNFKRGLSTDRYGKHHIELVTFFNQQPCLGRSD
jgi:hypothetical protein